MRYFFYAFRLELRQSLRRRGTRLLPVLAVMLTAALLLLPGKPATAVVQVGLAVPEGQGDALVALLLERSSELVQFVPTDEETLDKMILSGSWDCGLVIPEDFDRRLENLDTKRLLTLKTGPGSTVSPLVRETVSACLMELMTPYIAGDYLRQIGASEETLEAHLEALSQSAQRVQVNLQTLDGEAMDPLTMTASGVRRLLRGLIGVLTLVYGLYLSMDLGKWLNSDPVTRLRSVRRETELLLPRLAAAVLPLLCWGTILLPCLAGSWRSAAAFPVFCVVIAGIALVVSRFRRLWQAVPVLLPFLAVGCLIFEPVLVDVGSLFPGLKPWTAWLPVGLFLRAADGSLPALAWLAGEGAVLLLASLALDSFSRKKHA